MDRMTLGWLAFGAYIAITTWLAWLGMKRTKDLASFALGNRDMGPVLVGITLAASVASSATFVINPGFVYAHGVAALNHFGVAATAGVTLGLIVLSTGFRKKGAANGALTLPHWLGARYGHGAMRTYFAVLNLLLAISFVVLIVKGSALVMQFTLGLDYLVAVFVVVLFVFSYIMMGGTYAHAYTNVAQGVMMAIVALALVASGVHLLGDGVGPFLDRIAAQDPALVSATNPNSPLFSSWWEVFGAPFVVGFGLVCQPHILIKSLYLKSDRDVTRYLVVSSVVGGIFALVLVVGLYARVEMPGIESQDAVVAQYIGHAFPPLVGVLISVALIAAGMSTMDGILVSASTIAGSDLFERIASQGWMKHATAEQRQRAALHASRAVLVAMGIGAVILAIDPPELVGLFAQVGVYGLVAASLAPVSFGIFFDDVDPRAAFVASLVGPLVHFAHYGIVVFGYGTFANPALTAAEGALVSVAVLAIATFGRRLLLRRSR